MFRAMGRFIGAHYPWIIAGQLIVITIIIFLCADAMKDAGRWKQQWMDAVKFSKEHKSVIGMPIACVISINYKKDDGILKFDKELLNAIAETKMRDIGLKIISEEEAKNHTGNVSWIDFSIFQLPIQEGINALYQFTFSARCTGYVAPEDAEILTYFEKQSIGFAGSNSNYENLAKDFLDSALIKFQNEWEKRFENNKYK